MSNVFVQKIVYHCAPALNGIKSSNLVNLKINEFESLEEDIADFNSLNSCGIFTKVLCSTATRILILVYKKENLIKCLKEKSNFQYLNEVGYSSTFDLDNYLSVLSNRIQTNSVFPHEIGVFLNYDLNDVKGLINNEKCLYTGCWKVFSNVVEKRKIFDKYIRCREKMLSEIKKRKMLDSILGV